MAGEGSREHGASKAEHAFEFTGGNLALDFANTVSWRHGAPEDHVRSYADLVSWARQAGIISARDARDLLQSRPDRQSSVLKQALKLREAFYRLFSAVAAGKKPDESDLATVAGAVKDAFARIRLAPSGSSFRIAWDQKVAPDTVLWPAAYAALELLTRGPLTRVRECSADTCGWLFLDETRNRSRRWCDMRTCGNRAKARRRYERQKTAAP
jgi:predicted RNA-binding Zn ribbon-like protein